MELGDHNEAFFCGMEGMLGLFVVSTSLVPLRSKHPSHQAAKVSSRNSPWAKGCSESVDVSLL